MLADVQSPAFIQWSKFLRYSSRPSGHKIQEMVDALLPGHALLRQKNTPGSMKYIVGPDRKVILKSRTFSDLGDKILDLATNPNPPSALDQFPFSVPKKVDKLEWITLQKKQAEAKINKILSELEDRTGKEVELRCSNDPDNQKVKLVIIL